MTRRRKPNSYSPAKLYAPAPPDRLEDATAAAAIGNVWITMLRDANTGEVSIGGVWLSEAHARECGIDCPVPDTDFFPLGPIGIGRDLFATVVGRTIIDTIPSTPDEDVIRERPETEQPPAPAAPDIVSIQPVARRRFPWRR